MRRAALLLSAAAALLLPTPALAEPAHTGYPSSLAAAGDSITRAFDTGPLLSDAPQNSWATGISSAVQSHYLRIRAAHPAIGGHAFNDAVTGARMSGLAAQVRRAVAQHAEEVAILMGANDVCTSSEATMTPTATFRAEFLSALTALSRGLPNARIYVVSLPDVERLWAVLHGDAAARNVWSSFHICQSMLARPTSTAPADVARRARVRRHEADLNAQLAAVCARFVHCRYDGGAVFRFPFTVADVNRIDFFHPSIAGQAALARVSYAAGFRFADAVAPVTTATTTHVQGGTRVALSARDAAGVRGVELRLGAGPYRRYTGPLVVPTGTMLTYRAVDVNGNVEATHTLVG